MHHLANHARSTKTHAADFGGRLVHYVQDQHPTCLPWTTIKLTNCSSNLKAQPPVCTFGLKSLWRVNPLNVRGPPYQPSQPRYLLLRSEHTSPTGRTPEETRTPIKSVEPPDIAVTAEAIGMMAC